jgi:hypothetical protein
LKRTKIASHATKAGSLKKLHIYREHPCGLGGLRGLHATDCQKKRKSANKQAFLYSRQGKGKKRRNISADFKKFEYPIVMAVFLVGGGISLLDVSKDFKLYMKKCRRFIFLHILNGLSRETDLAFDDMYG